MRSESIEEGAPLGITCAPRTSAACACGTLLVSVVTGLRPPSQTIRFDAPITTIRNPAAIARRRFIVLKSRRRCNANGDGEQVTILSQDPAERGSPSCDCGTKARSFGPGRLAHANVRFRSVREGGVPGKCRLGQLSRYTPINAPTRTTEHDRITQVSG